MRHIMKTCIAAIFLQPFLSACFLDFDDERGGGGLFGPEDDFVCGGIWSSVPERTVQPVGERLEISPAGGIDGCEFADYRLSLLKAPAGSFPKLEDAGGSGAFTADVEGEYVIRVEAARSGEETSSREVNILAYRPTAEINLGSWIENKDCIDADVENGRLFCVFLGVTVIDPSTGSVMGRTAEEVPVLWGLDADGDILATATYGNEDYKAGVYVYRVGQNASPALVSFIDIPEADDLDLTGGLMAVTNAEGTVMLFDVTDPAAPRRLGRSAAGIGSIPVIGDAHVYAFGENLSVFRTKDLEDEGAGYVIPRGAAKLESPPAFTTAIAKNGEVFYVATSGGIDVYDVGREEAPVLIYRFDHMAGRSLAISHGMLMAAGEQEVVAFDVSDPAKPVPAASLRLDCGYHIVADGGRMLIVGCSGFAPVEVKN